ncbi:MAG: Spy/CpxP family protein refolding chaperone [Stellaceae bacterium]
MVRFSTSTALYLAVATLLGGVALPASMDFAATQLSDPALPSLARAPMSAAAPSEIPLATRAKSISVQRGAEPSDRVEAQIKQLHVRLKITPEQEEQWNVFAQVMRANAQTMQSQIEQRQKDLSSMSAVDALNSYIEITETHAQALKKLIPEFQALYDAMSPDQQKNADMVFSRYSREMAERNGMSAPTGSASQKRKPQMQ